MHVWVVGAGFFGVKAVRRLTNKDPNITVTLVDIDPDRLDTWGPPIRTVVDDGVVYLARHLEIEPLPDWIVAALPKHLAFEWIKETLLGFELKPIDLPDYRISQLPNPVRGLGGALYLSHADFRCPDTCTEPPEQCTVTGRPRRTDMHRLITDIQTPSCRSVVIRSHQLLPGVGGYAPAALLSARENVRRCRGDVLIATACACHAVVHPVYVYSPKQTSISQ